MILLHSIKTRPEGPLSAQLTVPPYCSARARSVTYALLRIGIHRIHMNICIWMGRRFPEASKSMATSKNQLRALWSKKYPLHHIINFGVSKNSRFYLPTNGPLEPPTRSFFLFFYNNAPLDTEGGKSLTNLVS
ncbi:hypothetical protein TWF225_006644 [Orbilia oligospora]|nr:hypothetical protein TWF225_006644 [Orbilia oligospora]